VSLTAVVVHADAFGRTDIVAVDDFIDAPRAVFGRTRDAVQRTLGPPPTVQPRMLAAGAGLPMEPAEDLAYPGIVITVSRRSASVRRVRISEPRWTLPRGLNVGVERRRVEETLGEPQLTADTSVLYLDADGFPNTVEFQFRGDRVHWIEWSFAVTD
jgi:hypothetical protein